MGATARARASVAVIIVGAAAPAVAVIPGLFVAALDLVKQFLQARRLLGRVVPWLPGRAVLRPRVRCAVVDRALAAGPVR